MDDFFALHSDRNDAGWCFCVAWWVETWEGWGERSAEANRSLRRDLFEAGHHDGYLVYEDGRPVGWCQVGQRDRLPKLVERYDLAPDPAAWAVTCFFIAPDQRGRGLARTLLTGVIADLERRGVTYLQAFPRRGRLDAGEAWTGPEALFAGAGFRLERDAPRPVYGLVLGDHTP